MGIRDRDYMKRRPEDDDDDRHRSSAPQNQLEAGLARFLQRNPRFFVWITVGFGVLILLSLAVAKSSSGN